MRTLPCVSRLSVTLLSLPWLLALAACGSDEPACHEGHCHADAPAAIADAAPGTPDAPTSGSVVTITPDCTGIDPADIDATVVATNFMFSDATPTIPVGGIIRFESTGTHNMASVGSVSTFTTGSPRVHVACLQFAVADVIDFVCTAHGNMTGTVTVQ